jgi:predicted transcriptional regulator
MAVTNVPPDQLAANWANNLAGAQARMQAGAQAVTTPPGQAAAAQQAVWLANVTAAANRWAQNVAAVTTQQWQTAYISKGLPRVASGAQAAQANFATILGRIIAAEKTIVPGLPARGNIDANIARSAAFARAMNQLKGTF